jgi:hypothetical protein
LWAAYAFSKLKSSGTIVEKTKILLKPLNSWGPIDQQLNAEYKEFLAKEL